MYKYIQILIVVVDRTGAVAAASAELGTSGTIKKKKEKKGKNNNNNNNNGRKKTETTTEIANGNNYRHYCNGFSSDRRERARAHAPDEDDVGLGG